MTRNAHAAHFAGLHVAQEARRDARSGDADYARGEGRARFGSASEQVDTDQAPDPPHRKAAYGPSLAVSRSGAPLHGVVALCRAAGLPEPTPEHRFHPLRRWRFDYAWPLDKLALEIEGGIWTQGRHTRGTGALGDLAKYSEAAILGWRVIYATPGDLQTTGMDRIRRALA